jgi:hypothetical protein
MTSSQRLLQRQNEKDSAADALDALDPITYINRNSHQRLARLVVRALLCLQGNQTRHLHLPLSSSFRRHVHIGLKVYTHRSASMAYEYDWETTGAIGIGSASLTSFQFSFSVRVKKKNMPLRRSAAFDCRSATCPSYTQTTTLHGLSIIEDFMHEPRQLPVADTGRKPARHLSLSAKSSVHWCYGIRQGGAAHTRS